MVVLQNIWNNFIKTNTFEQIILRKSNFVLIFLRKHIKNIVYDISYKWFAYTQVDHLFVRSQNEYNKVIKYAYNYVCNIYNKAPLYCLYEG